MKGSSIRDTLLRLLFTSPRPINKALFDGARPILFPDEAAFVEFLSTEDHQEQVECAQRIITNLSYHHRCPAPHRLLNTLLATQEERRVGIREGDYVPRDHFVHLAHLYLLGIYLFAYHGALNTSCAKQLVRLKRNDLAGDRGAANTYAVFATFWVQFVSYHDLGYPFEMLPPADRERHKAWFAPYKSVPLWIHLDLACKALAQIAAMHGIIEERDEASFSDDVVVHYGQDARHDADVLAQLEKWKDAIILPKMTHPGGLKQLLALVPQLEVCCCLEHRDSGVPYAVVIPDKQEVIKLWGTLPRALQRHENQLPQLAMDGFTAVLGKHIWRYYAIDPKGSFDTACRKALGDNWGLVRKLCLSLAEDRKFQHILTHGVSCLERLGAHVYGLLLDQCELLTKEAVHDPKLRGELDGALARTDISHELENAVSTIGKSFGKAITAVVDSYLRKNLDRSLYTGLVVSGGEATAQRIYESAKLGSGSTATSLWKRVGEELDGELFRPAARNTRIRESAANLAALTCSDAAKKRSPYANPLETTKVNADFSLSTSLRAQWPLFGALDSNLRQRGLDTFEWLVEHYRPAYVQHNRHYTERPERYVDHGFASAVVSSICASEYALLLSSLDAPVSQRRCPLIRMALRVGTTLDRAAAEFDVRLLGAQTTEIVALHNVYTDDLGDRADRYRTDLSGQPLAYLALLADGLQNWDRESLVRQSLGPSGSHLPGNRYDVQIRDGYLWITVNGRKLNIEREHRALTATLSSYLKNADALIRLALSQNA